MVLSRKSGFLCYKITKGNWISPVFSWMEVIPEAGGEDL